MVPAYVWKVIVMMKKWANDLYRINENTRVVAVIMPNTQAISSMPWTSYRVSVDKLEARTGLGFLSNVSSSIQTVIEANIK